MGDADETQFGDTQPAEPSGPALPGVPGIGEVLAEKYVVERVLGQGGMGVVVAVRHLTLNEPYAIKCLLPGGAKDPDTVERFMREARAAVRIKSEHIARVSDVGQLPNGAPYILMEHLVGRDLSEVLEHGPLAVGDAVEFVLQACTGIAEAHALGIVHRDLKPGNLFLTQRLDGAPLVKVLDFGISKALGDAAPHQPSLTQTASTFGSPAYMSPEQVRSAKNVDFRTDLWSIGVILHELLTGSLPFIADTSSGLLAAIVADEPTPVRASRPDVSEGLEAVVLRCLEKDLKKRFQTISELAVALEPFRSQKSLVSIGRILRLSGPPSAPLVQPSTRDVMKPVPVGAATDAPWTTARSASLRGSPKLLGLVVVAAIAVLATTVFYMQRKIGQSASRVASESQTSASPASASSDPAPPVVVATVVATAPAPSAIASSAASVAGAAPAPNKGGRRPSARPTPSSVSAPPVAAPPATPRPNGPVADPTAESH